ncbi:MAG: hypothetical protein M1817_005727 [Caeruleum heppii]|nr:MAG: hypothetical protein M1817_005727 [Caeruleum heppii]
MDHLEDFIALFQDLECLSDPNLPISDGLWGFLEAKVDEFRELLDKPARNETARKSLSSGKIDVAGQEYAVNDVFLHTTLQVADTLDLDEREAARLLVTVQEDVDLSDRPSLVACVIRFHQKWQYLVDCLRMILRYGTDLESDLDDNVRTFFRDLVNLIVQPPNGQRKGGSSYAQKCLSSMGHIRNWLQDIENRIQSVSMIGQFQEGQSPELLRFQQRSLTQQHESLAGISYYLTKASVTGVDECQSLLSTVRRMDKYDVLLVHLLLPLTALLAYLGSAEGRIPYSEAQSLYQTILGKANQDEWSLKYLHAAVVAFWLGEYGSWYDDSHHRALPANVDLETEDEERLNVFLRALQDGAFDFMLSLSIDVKPAEMHDPIRSALRQDLQMQAPPLLGTVTTFSIWFQGLVMEQLESFIDAFITNMPAALRRLRSDEDKERLQTLDLGRQHEMDLEKFILLISYVFEHRPDAAQSFWQEADSNLYGFLMWSAKRLTTPRAHAFCEMLLAIASNEENATAAHIFLLQAPSTSKAKLRKDHALNWAQIFQETEYFASKIQDSPMPSQGPSYTTDKNRRDQTGLEQDTYSMLQSYLRLTAQLARESPAARQWLLNHPTFHLLDLLSLLIGSIVPAQLRACAFDTMHALLTQKTPELGDRVWQILDHWRSSGIAARGGAAKSGSKSLAVTRTDHTDETVFETVAEGFEQPTAFVRLLTALVQPYPEDVEPRDGLPFPEHLGSTNRMPGIDPYVDFALKHVFGRSALEFRDTVRQQILQVTCLDFMLTCLSTFNENLVVLADRTPVSVDDAVTTSSLVAYARLHPFRRVMEWLFNDIVLHALFETAHQDPTDVSDVLPDSPLFLSLVRSVQIITVVLDMQYTYLDIVRPVVKMSGAAREEPVANAAYSSFEDAILSHLELVSDLGLYCGTDHRELVIVSLELLQRLSTSHKLIASTTASFGVGSSRNKVIATLDMNGEADRISRSMVSRMQPSDRELTLGPVAPGYIIKEQILNFLDDCLASQPDQPTIAHLLLGFSCRDNIIEVLADTPFANDDSLFHTHLAIILGYPNGTDGILQGWLLQLKKTALSVMRRLWSSPLSSGYTMTELRAHEFLFQLCRIQVIIQPDTLFDGRTTDDVEFLLTESARCLEHFLKLRTFSLSYSAAEIRLVAQERMPTLQKRIISTLLGRTMGPDGDEVATPSILDLLDFAELEIGDVPPLPNLRYFQGVDFAVCMQGDGIVAPRMHNIDAAKQLLTLHHNALRMKGAVIQPADAQAVDNEAVSILAFLEANNQKKRLLVARLETLRAWVQLMIVMLESCDIDSDLRTTLILQTLQLTLPKLERYATENVPAALELARLSKVLLSGLRSGIPALSKSRAGDITSERLFHLFRISLRGIQSPLSTDGLRELLYSICYRYLMGLSDTSTKDLKRHNTQTIKTSGERLIDIICDDGFVGDGTCRVSALLLLDALVDLAQEEDSAYVVECLARLNYIGILVDSIQAIPSELRAAQAQDVPLLLSYYGAKLSLLLRISRTRLGAAHVLNAGLFSSVRQAGLFSVDPDLGLDIDNPDALKKYYELLLSILRIIASVVLSRGPQNQQSIEQARRFLAENRSLLVAVLKRSANIGGLRQDGSGDLDDVVENFVLLVSVTGFLDFEEKTTLQRSSSTVFS